MERKRVLIVLLVILTISLCLAISKEEIEAKNYLTKLNAEFCNYTNREMLATWELDSNITDENKEKLHKISAEFAEYSRKIASEVGTLNWTSFKDKNLNKELQLYGCLDYAALNETERDEFTNIKSTMESFYGSVKVCNYTSPTQCNLTLEPDIENVFENSRDPAELKYYWLQFYNSFNESRKPFEKYVELKNKASVLNNFKSGAEWVLNAFGGPTIEQQLDTIMADVMPLYKQLHGYVRYRLRQFYGKEHVSEKGPIPMHLVGDVWGQKWNFITDIVAPFPNKNQLDVTDELVKQGYTPKKMFELAEEFFVSLNFKKLPKEFWENSIIEQPKDDRNMVCHAGAWDFFKLNDVRIKMCTRPTHEHLYAIHHEMGHVHYYLQYQHLPYVYRYGANPGFHEAVGDLIALSVMTPRHLERVGLLKNYVADKDSRITQLFNSAMEKIVLLPFSVSLDKYRFALHRGEIDKNNSNCAFWKARTEYSGIEPPVLRSENDFDPPAKYHVSADTDFLRYFYAIILQFQLYKTSCILSGEYEPSNPDKSHLDSCDFYQSKTVGKALAKLLSVGSSKPLPDLLAEFGDGHVLSGEAIAEYYAPLRIWLEDYNKKNNVTIDWTTSDKCVS